MRPGTLVRPFGGHADRTWWWLYEMAAGQFKPTAVRWGGEQLAVVLRSCQGPHQGEYLELLVAGQVGWAYRGWVEPVQMS